MKYKESFLEGPAKKYKTEWVICCYDIGDIIWRIFQNAVNGGGRVIDHLSNKARKRQ